MKRYFFGSAAAVVCAGSLVAAQAPAGQGQQNPSQPQTPSASQERPTTQASAGATTTVTGCVYREQDVPGRTPNVAERAGVLEDYILADVRMSSTGAGATGTSGAGSASDAVGGGGAAAGGAAATSGSASSASAGSMYKLEFVDDNKLQALVGKRVEVTGRVDREAGDAGGRTQGTTGVSGGATSTTTRSTGAPGAASGDPGSAGNRSGDSAGAAGQAGATASGQAGAATSQPGAQADRSIGPDQIELAEFEVVSIREMAGTCPATPAAR